MKELNLPFKKLSVANFSQSVLSLLFPPLVMGVLHSCTAKTAKNDRDILNSSEYGKSDSLVKLVDQNQNWFRLTHVSQSRSPQFIKIDPKSCVTQKLILGMALDVMGQTYEIRMEEDSSQVFVAQVEDSETRIPGIDVTPELRNEVCERMSDQQNRLVVIEDASFEFFKSAMLSVAKNLVPDCVKVEVNDQNIQCRMVSVFPQSALVQTDEFQKAMIRKWSRQPYILARRIGLIGSLAKTAIDQSNDEKYNKFCRILQFSLPEELPIVMTSKRWQGALCSGNGKLRNEAALYGLAKSTQELNMLKELYESTSAVGMLAVKIPEDVIPDRVTNATRQPLRVKIIPDEKVSRKLVEEAKNYLGRPVNERQLRRLSRHKRLSRSGQLASLSQAVAENIASQPQNSSRLDMCWHPVFGESWSLLRTADGMKLAGDGFKYECGFVYERSDAVEIELASFSKYLLHSLSSETEFVIDNGQTKLLRLPAGQYSYSIHVLPANPLDSEEIDDENAPKSTGRLEWGSSRRHLINSW